ncbi:DUF6443 domain-containing protein [Flammeovirgaceae bacterium SG7u.111]|nr:DUF6443 domain-containing protein [Flammeovirgaceae bacterium SG7u.132]WPO36746.1 DUF6443 domain-containing protein [Flammeovirgaceae bacterium SG7u.111]
MRLKIYSLFLLVLGWLAARDAQAQTDKNYVRTHVYKKVNLSSDPNGLSKDQVQTSTQYLDGLGRPIQNVVKKGSPEGLDIVIPIVYDQFGREANSYLPYVSGTGSDGSFKTGAVSAQQAFYGGLFTGEGTSAFTTRSFEASPLNRVLDETGPGKNWHDNDKKVSYLQKTNLKTDGIRIWTVGTAAGATPSTSDTYGDGELYVTEMTDEEGHISREYTDKQGKVVLKEVQDGNGFLKTYYVYDDYGNLRYVLPPKAIEKMGSSYSGHASFATILANLCFKYTYDARNRMVAKRVPGTGGETYMVYDKLDRLVLVQDVKQRTRNEWLFTKYDRFSRPVLTGIYTESPGVDVYASMKAVDPSNYAVGTVESDEGLLEGKDIVSEWHEGHHTYRASNSIALLPGFKVDGAAQAFVADISSSVNTGDRQHGYAVQAGDFPAAADLYVLTASYYDDYDLDNDGTADETYADVGEASFMPEQAVTYDVKGLLTATKVRQLGDGDNGFLKTVTFYDQKGRVVQTQGKNHNGGTDIVTNQYDFVGKVTHTHTRHSNPKADKKETVVKNWFYYDHADRLLEVKQAFDLQTETGAEVLASNTYNALGQLEEKAFAKDGAQSLQAIDYRYNIRGWLTKINDLDGVDEDRLFAMELQYENTGDEKAQYNGNIGRAIWKTDLDGVQRQYSYAYDDLNRLTGADYSATGRAYENFDVVGIGYDANGNIEGLQRYGLTDLGSDPTQNTYGRVDNLSYEYESGGISNRLTAVTDDEGLAGDALLADFKDGKANGQKATSGEYGYDQNGNLTSDKNKGIVDIDYNHLNLPELIDFGSGNTIRYRYDAAGVKLQKKVYEGGKLAKTTDYLGGFHYEEDTLRFVHTAEGRALWKTEHDGLDDFVYEYHYKDHLGNLRMSVRKGDPDAVYEATSELAMQDYEEEQLGFENIKVTQDMERAKNGQVSALVRNTLGYQLPVGPFKQFEVGRGDKIAASVFVSCEGDNGGAAATQSPMSPGTSMGNSFVPEGQSAPIGLSFGVRALGDNPTTNEPAAYITVELYNSDGSLVGKETRWVSGMYGGWYRLSPLQEVAVEQDGYAKVYVANESAAKVWFDDLQITHKKGIIAQENHYYPFGMNMAGIERQGMPDHKFQYNGGVEKEENFGLNWYETEFRSYDNQLGRWHQVDPLAEAETSWTPYRYGFNNPIRLNDPTGLLEAADILKFIEKGGQLPDGFKWTSNDTGDKDKNKGENTSNNGTGWYTGVINSFVDASWSETNLIDGVLDEANSYEKLIGTGKLLMRKETIPIYNESGVKIAAFHSYSKLPYKALKLTSKGLQAIGPATAVIGAGVDIYKFKQGEISGKRLTYKLVGNGLGLYATYALTGPAGLVVGGAFYVGEIIYDIKKEQHRRFEIMYKNTPEWNKVKSVQDTKRLLNWKTWFSGLNLSN